RAAGEAAGGAPRERPPPPIGPATTPSPSSSIHHPIGSTEHLLYPPHHVRGHGGGSRYLARHRLGRRCLALREERLQEGARPRVVEPIVVETIAQRVP